MPTWRIAGVQVDCRLGDTAGNLAAVRRHLAAAADGGAKLVVFPECVLTGYGFADRAAGLRAAEPIPGPAAETLAADCAKRNVWAIVGLLESAGGKLFNALAIVGPGGQVFSYRKLHLPCLGVDRFTDPGDRPLAVHDLGGLTVGPLICFDGSFPEAPRILALQGADLIVQPTNWVPAAIKNATLVNRVRAFENHVYFMSVNRVGIESGYEYCGHSAICDPAGDFLAEAFHDREAIVYADVDPELARRKRVVFCPGEYEIDRIHWRRPELYGPLVAPIPPFLGHENR